MALDAAWNFLKSQVIEDDDSCWDCAGSGRSIESNGLAMVDGDLRHLKEIPEKHVGEPTDNAVASKYYCHCKWGKQLAKNHDDWGMDVLVNNRPGQTIPEVQTPADYRTEEE